VHVFDDDQQRADAARPIEEVAHRGEQPQALAVRGQRRRRPGRVAGEARHQRRELMCGWADDALELVRRKHVGGGLDQLDDRQVGQRLLSLDALTTQHDEAACGCDRRCFLAEARLANAGLAADEHEMAATLRRAVDERGQLSELARAAGERRWRRRRRIAHGIPPAIRDGSI
jgi:hypothetical protein